MGWKMYTTKGWRRGLVVLAAAISILIVPMPSIRRATFSRIRDNGGTLDGVRTIRGIIERRQILLALFQWCLVSVAYSVTVKIGRVVDPVGYEELLAKGG